MSDAVKSPWANDQIIFERKEYFWDGCNGYSRNSTNNTERKKKKTNHKWAMCASNGNAVIFSYNNLSLWFRCHTEFRNFTWITLEAFISFWTEFFDVSLLLSVAAARLFYISFCVFSLLLLVPSVFAMAKRETHRWLERELKSTLAQVEWTYESLLFFSFSYVYVYVV